MSRKWLILTTLTLMLTACDECRGLDCRSGDSPPFATLRFSMIGDATGAQDFIAATDDFQVFELAAAEMRLPLAERTLFIIGPIDRGNGEYPNNLNWNWHFPHDEWNLTDAANVLCDGNAEIVEQAVDYWVDTVGQFCPAGARVVHINIIQH